MPAAVTQLCSDQPHGRRRVKSKTRDLVKWDAQVPGLGLRIYAFCDSVWILQHRERGRQRKVTLGSSTELTRDEARKAARKLLGGNALKLALADPSPATEGPPLFSAFVEEFWAVKLRGWKPATQRTTRRFIDKEFLPTFGDMRVDDIDRAAVMRWRDGLRATPGNANRALPILSKIMDHAERQGFRPKRTNPCARVTRFNTGYVDRFLSRDEMAALGRAMQHASPSPTMATATAIVRLLLLTGARSGEILSLRWCTIDGVRAALSDSKTGERVIYLNTPALAVLATLPRRTAWVFPNYRGDGPLRSVQQGWYKLRAAAGLSDVRLHDLRHSFASHAILLNESLPIVGRLLGHALPESTQRYIHFAESDLGDAATRITGKLACALRGDAGEVAHV